MPHTTDNSIRLRNEADLVSRFAESYRRKFADMIAKLNHRSSPESDAASLRLCVEAMDMMLSNHAMLARAIAGIDEAKLPESGRIPLSTAALAPA